MSLTEPEFAALGDIWHTKLVLWKFALDEGSFPTPSEGCGWWGVAGRGSKTLKSKLSVTLLLEGFNACNSDLALV